MPQMHFAKRPFATGRFCQTKVPGWLWTACGFLMRCHPGKLSPCFPFPIISLVPPDFIQIARTVANNRFRDPRYGLALVIICL